MIANPSVFEDDGVSTALGTVLLINMQFHLNINSLTG